VEKSSTYRNLPLSNRDRGKKQETRGKKQRSKNQEARDKYPETSIQKQVSRRIDQKQEDCTKALGAGFKKQEARSERQEARDKYPETSIKRERHRERNCSFKSLPLSLKSLTSS
jgi:hypothetical protein